MSDNQQGNYSFEMTDIGEGIAEVEVVEWPVNVGDQVEEDDVICVVMTDKASVEITSPVDGTVIALGAAPGDMISVGSELMRLHTDEAHANYDPNNPKHAPSNMAKEATPEPEAIKEETQQKTAEVKPESVQTEPVTEPKPVANAKPAVPRAAGEKPIAAPAVRQRAQEAGIDLRQVHGTGPAGRILHSDLDSFMAGSQTTTKATGVALTDVEEIKVIGLRRKIARVMQDTMQRIPHFTYVEEIDVTELEKLRQKLNAERSEHQPKLTVLPFLMRAIVKGIAKYPQMSSLYNDVDDIVQQFAASHIGIATQTDNGLMVPVVRHAESLTLWNSAAEVKRLSTEARNGSISRDELSGSTITITSLGPMGGVVSTPVINSPEVAIIGVNKIVKRPMWQDGMFVPRDMMNLSSSFDHRIIDGWDATLFVQYLKSLLETPASLFLEE